MITCKWSQSRNWYQKQSYNFTGVRVKVKKPYWNNSNCHCCQLVQTINNDAILLTVLHESVRLLWVNYYFYYLNNINNKSRGKLTWEKQRRSRWLLGNDILLARCLGFWHSFSGSPRLLCIISWTNWERRSKLTHCQKLNQSDPIMLSFHRIWWNILNL